MRVDIVVIVPLEEEFREFSRVFELGQNLTEETLPTYKFQLDGITGVVILQDEMGYWGATRAANSIIGRISCAVMTCIGIAGKVSNDLKIGDVCYSGTVIDTVTNGKIVDDEKGAQRVALAPDFFPTPKLLHGTLTFFRVMPEFGVSYRKWQEEAYKNEQEEAKVCALSQHVSTRPNSLQGNIACGLVSQSSAYKDSLKGVNRKILAIETESGAVARFCFDNGMDFVSIRGISDNADESKKEYEENTKDLSRRVAAFNAFSFLRGQIRDNEFFRRYLMERRPIGKVQPTLPLSDDIDNPLADAQEVLLHRTVARLRETNQSFRSLPEGAVLPLPRILPRPTKVAPASKRGSPLEIREGVASFQRIFALVPRVFPDKSLAWLIAHALLYEQWNERQFVPIVIAGSEIRPPRGTIERLAEMNLQKIRNSGGTLVFILDSFSLTSKTNANFLAELMKNNDKDRFIVLSDDEPNIREIEEFVSHSKSEHVDIVDTSFAEIVNFLASHFSMQPEAAQVVALRLRNVFKKFNLQVHPTFFAGIPQELIASILDANRRGELIQLAVDGYLTHVVSTDREKGRLSRTTRSDYLRALIRGTKLESIILTTSDLKEFTAKFFAERGFPNDPANFVKCFFDTGVFISNGERVEFGLTFIESYFAALELCNSPSLALAYFDFEASNFDYRTFDLFAELCASQEFVSALITKIDSLDIFTEARDPVSKLESGEIHPEMMKNPKIASAVSQRVEIASKAISDGHDETKEKQQLLDIAERVFDESKGRDANNEKTDPAAKRLNAALGLWSIAVVLLGQGAEKLDDDRKKLLAAKVSKLGALIIEDWTIYNTSFDFSALKLQLTEKESLDEMIDPTLELPPGVSAVELLRAMVDIVEMALASEPLRAVLNHVSDEACHRVLLPSLVNVRPSTFLEKVLLASWLAEVDANSAKIAFKDLFKKFPNAPFLRASLATYYLFRVYWSMSEKESRLQLLQYANDLMKPLGKSVSVREIAKQISGAVDRNDDLSD